MEKSVEEAILKYCDLKSRLTDESKRTKEERAESIDAKRTIGNLLLCSMEKNDVRCVCLGDDVGDKKYVRLAPPSRRSMKVDSFEKVYSLLEGVSSLVSTVPDVEVPSHVVRIFKERALERGPPPGPPRLVQTKRPLKSDHAKEIPHLPSETKRLTSQYAEAKREYEKCKENVSHLRSEVKSAETSLLPLLPSEGALVKLKKGDKESVVRLIRVDPPPPPPSSTPSSSSKPSPPTPPPSNPSPPPSSNPSDQKRLSLRSASQVVRTAAEEAVKARSTPDIDFDVALRACVSRLLSSNFGDCLPPQKKPRLKSVSYQKG